MDGVHIQLRSFGTWSWQVVRSVCQAYPVLESDSERVCHRLENGSCKTYRIAPARRFSSFFVRVFVCLVRVPGLWFGVFHGTRAVFRTPGELQIDPVVSIYFIAAGVGVFAQRRDRRLVRCVVRGLCDRVVQSVGCFAGRPRSTFRLCLFFDNSRLEVKDGYYETVHRGLCFQGGHCVRFLNVDRSLLSVLLDVIAELEGVVGLVVFPFPARAKTFAFEASFGRFEVFLCFGAPTLVVHRVPVGNIRLRTYRFVGGHLRDFFPFRVADFIGRRQAP